MNLANQMRAEGSATVERMYALMHRSLELESHVMLMLNPDEAPHKKIAEVTTKARIAVFRTQANFDPKSLERFMGGPASIHAVGVRHQSVGPSAGRPLSTPSE